MSKVFLTPIKLVNLSNDPRSHNAGDMYYNTAERTPKFFDGTQWQSTFSQGGNTVLNLDGGGAGTTDFASSIDGGVA